VLTGLLRHPSEHVRQTAAQALERTADASILEGLLKGLDDSNVTVRFSLVGAVGRAAAGGGQALSLEQRKRLLARLEGLLKRDADQGVRSRAATVLGEVAEPSFLPTLWAQVQTGSEGRVQEKAWDAFVEIIGRSGSPALLEQWEKTLDESKQPSRRVQLLARVFARWDQRGDTREAATKALESLVAVQLESGKWASAGPLAQNLLARATEGDGLRDRCLKWMLKIAELALQEGNPAEATRLAQEARGYLGKNDPRSEAFARIEKQAARKE
jgi:HEAT repeat protein